MTKSKREFDENERRNVLIKEIENYIQCLIIKIKDESEELSRHNIKEHLRYVRYMVQGINVNDPDDNF